MAQSRTRTWMSRYLLMTQHDIRRTITLQELSTQIRQAIPPDKSIDSLSNSVSAYEGSVDIRIRLNPSWGTVETTVDAKPSYPPSNLYDIDMHTPAVNFTWRGTRWDLQIISLSLAKVLQFNLHVSEQQVFIWNILRLSQYDHYYSYYHAIQAFNHRFSGWDSLCLRTSGWQPELDLKTPEWLE